MHARGSWWLAASPALALLCSCAVHPVVPAFRASLRVEQRGIFVPLPPPSLRATPEQEVVLDGTLEGELVADGSEVHLVDHFGEAAAVVELAPAQRNVVFAFHTNLADNCLELWVVSPTGELGMSTFVHTEIRSDTEVVIVQGCTHGDTD